MIEVNMRRHKVAVARNELFCSFYKQAEEYHLYDAEILEMLTYEAARVAALMARKENEPNGEDL